MKGRESWGKMDLVIERLNQVEVTLDFCRNVLCSRAEVLHNKTAKGKHVRHCAMAIFHDCSKRSGAFGVYTALDVG